MRGPYNLADLHAFSPWHAVNEFTNATYKISLCSKLADPHSCPDGTSVCAQYPNGTSVNYGDFSANPSIHTNDDDASKSDGELLLMLQGQACPDVSGGFYSTFFYFKCGKTLGHPRYLGEFTCSSHFEWESYVFCKKLPVPEKEVPCTVVKDGHLIDLSPLTKLVGGYLVDENEEQHRKIYINVCRDINPGTDDATKNCPKGSASCRVINNNGVNFGQPLQKLESTDDGVRLVYTAIEKPSGCLDIPSTTINFRCPDRGGSKDPVLLTDFLVTCSLEIEWVTEFACPTDHISSSTCKLTKEQHDIDIDLTPLKRAPLSPYNVTAKDGNDEYNYYINVCGNLGYDCGDKSNQGLTSVCQRKHDDQAFEFSAGDYRFMSLRYSDGQLTMIMRNGDACSSNFRRATMIDFYCNKTAVNNGIGRPEFVEHSNCSYFFKWGTKYACVDHPADGTCRVDVDEKRFDLSALVREEGTNWEVITGENERDNLTYFLNVCHDVLNTGAASACPAGAAVCSIGSQGAKNLGHYTQSLTYDKASGALRLNYTGGEKLDRGCEQYTVVNFFCSTGDFNSAPRLVHISDDNCYHEIEWHTASACVLSHKTGDNCRVVDNDAGYVFDLSPMTLQKGHYDITGSDGYHYLINVCGAITDDNYCNVPPHNNAAICQVKVGSASEMKKIGEPASKLEYFDGVLNLTYTNGEPYNNPTHTPRMAEIAFLCDMSAGIGRPTFLEEKSFTYAFQWRTSYACPVAPIECAVTDEQNHVQYDLSSLSKMSENWQIESRNDLANKRKFYINVCRPVAPVQGVRCSPFASVCATSLDNDGKETLYHGNLGRSETPPTIETSIRGVKLIYTNGDNCTDSDGSAKKFKTSIHFSCKEGKVAGGPTTPQQISPCEYSILWETEAACPVSSSTTEETNSSACSVRDRNSDFVFNLMPLAKPEGYDVKSLDGSKSYKVNICGGLPTSTCGKFDSVHPASVCKVGLGGNLAQAMVSTELEYSSQGEITLTYKGQVDPATGARNKYVFNFFCNRNAQSPVISYSGESFPSTTFSVKTALACAPQPVSCLVQDSQGNQYDLSTLARETGNYIVIDTRPNHNDLQYHINVCRPVNPMPRMTCPGGAVGGCQTSASGGQSYNMGYVQSEPVVSSTGAAITIHYEGGDKCHEGTDNEAYRSTRIIFFCDPVEHDPVFEAESDTCEYSFVWKTPSACPQQHITGANCRVTDPLYNFEFDLFSLRKTSGNYVVKGNGYDFLLNVCGPLVNGPGPCGTDKVGACQTGNTLSSPVQTGIYNDQPIYDSGQISLVYSEGKGSCHQQYNRTTVINFVCDHGQSGEAGPHYLDEKSDCTYAFEWPTRAACPPHQVTDCTYRHGEDIFDLSPLSRTDANWERVYNESQKMYIINVCRSLVHVKGQTCPFDAAACEIDLSQTDASKRFHNIGEVTSHSLSYESNTLILIYDNGEMCSTGKRRRSTLILFQCDTNMNGLGTPSGHFTLNECEDHFVWMSRAACPLSKQSEEVTKGFGDCKVTNPDTGYEFDLSSLKKAGGYTTYDREGHEFNLNVCGWLDSSSPCRNGTGSCQTEQTSSKTSVSAGDANARLLYRDGILVLEYGGGEICSSNKKPRVTIINFVCKREAGKGVPVYIDKSGDCLYYFDWHTELACETEVSCEVDTDSGNTLDFSPLIMKSGKYNVLPNDAVSQQARGTIYINICRPLNPIFGTLCPAGSGACLIRDGGAPLSLGHIDEGPVFNKATKDVRLTYTNGDPCPWNTAVNMSTVIVLKCGTAERLNPELETVSSECQYVILWETPLACTEKSQKFVSPSCSFYDTAVQTSYDLSSLSNVEKVPSSHVGFFNIKVCGHLDDKGDKGTSSCGQSSVCLSGGASNRDGSYGNSTSGVVQKDTEFLTLKYSQGRKCTSDSGQAVSSIYFLCDRTAGKGHPELLDDERDCEVSFRWKTSLVCPQDRKECVVARAGAMFDLSFLSQDTGSWTVKDDQGNIYWLNLCQAVHGDAVKAGCPTAAAACRKTKDGKVEMLGQLDAQNLTTEATSLTDVTVVLKYSEGNVDICNAGRRRRSGLSPSVIIRFTCGSTVGAPVFQKHTDQCAFEFTWKTRLACPIGNNDLAVTENNGQIHDSRTGATINLQSLVSSSGNKEVVEDNKKYLINLGGHLQIASNSMEAAHCRGAVVCESSMDDIHFRNLGSYSTKSYYMQDERLEVMFTSPEQCDAKQGKKNVTSTILFNCWRGDTETKPELLYHTAQCSYIFNWDTSLVCMHASPSSVNPSDGSSSASSGSNSNKSTGSSTGAVSNTKVGIVVSVFVGVMLVCILALILRKPERRAALASKVKRIVLCRKTAETPIIYSQLSQEADDNMAEDVYDPFNPFNEPDEETEINNSQLPSRARTYHDDSDEDLIL